MKTTVELIQENIARFEITCKQIDKGLIENAELIAIRKEVSDSRTISIHSTEELLQTLREQYKIEK